MSRPDCGSKVRHIRRIILEQSKRAGVGHIGSALSVVELLHCIYGHAMRLPENASDRDRFILSKGHAALALYAVLHQRGIVTEEQLNTYCSNGTHLGVHPELVLKGIDFSTGSLGQGLSFAVGAALAAKMQKSDRNVYVLMSDAELNEGSVWEAIMFAAHHKLNNLVVMVDVNGQQAFGFTKQVINTEPVAERWASFGWHVQESDGHNEAELLQKMSRSVGAKPRVILARTTFGKGVSFMEGTIKWHYSPLSDDEFTQAMNEVEAVK